MISFALVAPVDASTIVDLRDPARNVVRGALTGDRISFVTPVGPMVADFDGDGWPDLVVSTNEFEPAVPSSGTATVLFGPLWPGDVDLAAPIRRHLRIDGRLGPGDPYCGGGPSDNVRPRASGDLDGDGHVDLVVSAIGADGVDDLRPESGAVYVLFGPLAPGVVDAEVAAGLTIHGAHAWSAADGPRGLSRDNLGAHAATGDLDGDGNLDLALSATGLDRTDPACRDAGGVHVFFGPLARGVRDLAATPADLTIVGPAEDWEDESMAPAIGCQLAAEDLTDDGLDDLVMTCPGMDVGAQVDAGAVIVLPGPLGPGVRDLEIQPPEILVLPSAAERGSTTLGLADLSNDGRPDLLLAWSYTAAGPTRQNAGRAAVVFGPLAPGTHRLALNPADVTLLGAQSEDQLDFLAGGDIDGDGAADLLVTSMLGDGPDELRRDAGEAVVHLGPFTTGTVIDLAVDEPAIAVYGASGAIGPAANVGDVLVALQAADVTGDGRVELLASALNQDNGPLREDAGAIHVISVSDDEMPSFASWCFGASEGEPIPLLQVLGGRSRVMLSWEDVSHRERHGSSVTYDVVAGDVESLQWTPGASFGQCVASTAATAWLDERPGVPTEFYLVRARSACGTASFGGTAQLDRDACP